MSRYVIDPENPSQHIDVIELVRRNPGETPPPDSRIVAALLNRDTWTRREAIAILAGYAPGAAREYFAGVPIPAGYLDGTTALSLQAAGLSHPRESQILADCTMLSGYAQGQPDDEQRMPSEWLAWASSRGYRPYWLAESAGQVAAPAEQPASVAEQGTPAEQWKAARGDMKRRYALAVQMLRECQGNKTEAARRLGTKRQTIDRVLRKYAAGGAAGAAPMFAQLGGKPHEY